MPERLAPTEEHPSLFPASSRPWATRGIFSDHFLKNRLQQVASWPSDDAKIGEVHKYLMDLWIRRHVGLEKGNEETTCREFLEPVLQKLGFHCLYKLDLPASSGRMVPDYLLFPDEEAKDRVFDSDTSAKYEAATSLLEAKKVNHPLDALSKSELRFPHQQVRDYLSHATDQTGRPYFRWAILTNGNCWRLYCRDARPDAYFEFRLAGPKANFCTFEDFKSFVALFSSSVFVETDGICLLDQIRQESLQFQAELEESIRQRVALVVKDLANGFWSFKENNLAAEDLPKLYDACLILLYRLLFVLYAEGRGLLPVKLSGPGSNVNYRERYSLNRFVHKLRSRNQFLSDDFTDLYEELRKLFHLINGDRPSVNRACGVPLYNGGLFDRRSHPELENWQIGDHSLADVLRHLIFSAGPSQRAQQMEFEWGTIDYADLEVRQLGDIYEGLLGGHLESSNESNGLEVMGERSALQESGTFYTPDWVVRFLVEKTLRPLIARAEGSADVQGALAAGSKDNSFATAVLALSVLDPAMGSGHFLVRATEWLADEIVYHDTTRFQIEKVAPGMSQEQAEISYWRRRVVESCIYGVDWNPLAVELAKLSLWLTCIASEEPLNFLDHHLRAGNSLIGTTINELPSLRVTGTEDEDTQIPLSLGAAFSEIVVSAIREIAAIKAESSDRIETVKRKEQRWNDRVLARLRPFKDLADLWIAGIAGLAITPFEYYEIGQLILDHEISARARRRLAESLARFAADFERIKKGVVPFHWELEFPDVFFQENGQPKTDAGFDSILGNPPYVSTQTSSAFDYRELLESRFGFADDLYVHFVEKGFALLKTQARFGFIISDTFFTLNTKLRLRELLQSRRLDYLAQCDPFDATVDAAMFVAENSPNYDGSGIVTFIQARYLQNSKLELVFPKLLEAAERTLEEGTTAFQDGQDRFPISHSRAELMRLHRTAVAPYQRALKKAFFEPTDAIAHLYNRFNEPLRALVKEWWTKIETSRRFAENRDAILTYHGRLRAGHITLVGLVAEGAQGMRTGNNGRFLAYLEDTPQGKAVFKRREELAELWTQDRAIGPRFARFLNENGKSFDSAVELLKNETRIDKKLGLKRGEIYRTTSTELIATQEDFKRAFELRKLELKNLWKSDARVGPLYEQLSEEFNEDFFSVFREIYRLVENGTASPGEIGLRPGEIYSNAEDAHRIAAIYNGIPGKRQWVAFRKGDPEGHRWTTDEPLYALWSPENVSYLRDAERARWQGHSFFFLPGVTWTLFANHVGLKARIQPPCVFDASGSRLTPMGSLFSSNQFIAILNSDLFSFILKKFIKNTQDIEINDLRMAPLVIPTARQGQLETLANWAIKAKHLSLADDQPTAELLNFCKALSRKQLAAPSYLRPNAQMTMFQSPNDCLAIIELAVNWIVEDVYGMESAGPFDEF